ncbi:hypothetical protein PENANT_c194G09986 [Penicillium antarcticum]|uniref:Piwi domain-containing protein n=1 Tax=Penicillium antarcticum TaxID=416450 RepID=A0A1V6PAI4_9EURO|nr:hypothetical protein PENANT_c194G09986 [Penicillium antarcticum]
MFTPGSIPGRIIRFNKDHKVHIEDAISFLQEKYRPSIILVILSANAKKLGNIARLAYDVTYGIPAIELTHELLANSNQNWYARVGLMINLKLGGENHMVNSSDLSFFASGKTMIIGTNVAFARSASQGYFYTIAGLMVSSDSRLARWPAEIRVQHGKEPHIHKLNEMLETRIHSWAKKHGNKLPEDIVVYRNSEGEHEPWVEKEVCLIKDACRAAKLTVQDNLPRITVVLVDENYGAQLLPTADTECHRSGSPLAGTVVDRGLTVPRQWDFFLRSHNSTQGLNGPTRYFVVFDEVFRKSHPGHVKLNTTIVNIYGGPWLTKSYVKRVAVMATKAHGLCDAGFYLKNATGITRANIPEGSQIMTTPLSLRHGSTSTEEYSQPITVFHSASITSPTSLDGQQSTSSGNFLSNPLSTTSQHKTNSLSSSRDLIKVTTVASLPSARPAVTQLSELSPDLSEIRKLQTVSPTKTEDVHIAITNPSTRTFNHFSGAQSFINLPPTRSERISLLSTIRTNTAKDIKAAVLNTSFENSFPVQSTPYLEGQERTTIYSKHSSLRYCRPPKRKVLCQLITATHSVFTTLSIITSSPISSYPSGTEFSPSPSVQGSLRGDSTASTSSSTSDGSAAKHTVTITSVGVAVGSIASGGLIFLILVAWVRRRRGKKSQMHDKDQVRTTLAPPRSKVTARRRDFPVPSSVYSRPP